MIDKQRRISREAQPFVVMRGALPTDIRIALAEDTTYRGRFYRSANAHLARSVDISYINPASVRPVVRRLVEICRSNNPWRLSITRMSADMRVQRYRRGDFVETHSDYEPETGEHSKLTVVVPLVARESWRGGDLQIGNGKHVPRLEAGDAVIFPSYSPHQVTKVLAGERVILSAWMLGPRLA